LVLPDRWVIKAIPYFHALEMAAGELPVEEAPASMTSDRFISSLLTSHPTTGTQWKDFSRYLAFVRSCGDDNNSDLSLGAALFANSRGELFLRSFQRYAEIDEILSSWRNVFRAERMLDGLEMDAPDGGR